MLERTMQVLGAIQMEVMVQRLMTQMVLALFQLQVAHSLQEGQQP